MYSNELLQELRDYNPDNNKATRIYFKCLQAGKLDLASKIRSKYNVVVDVDDTIISMGLALMAANKKPK